VGLSISTPEFNSKQVRELVQRYQLNWQSNEVDRLMNAIGGNPDLVQQALHYLKNYPDASLDEFLATAPTEAGIYESLLREHLSNLLAQPKLAEAMRQVVAADLPVRLEPEESFKLQSMGLVSQQGNNVEPSCLLYRLYFRDRLELSK
jgi:hypothetical protein